MKLCDTSGLILHHYIYIYHSMVGGWGDGLNPIFIVRIAMIATLAGGSERSTILKVQQSNVGK